MGDHKNVSSTVRRELSIMSQLRLAWLSPPFLKILGKFIARAIADDCLPPAFVNNLGDAPSNSKQA